MRERRERSLTMTLKELERQLLALTPNEKAQAIQLLTQSLGNSAAWPYRKPPMSVVEKPALPEPVSQFGV